MQNPSQWARDPSKDGFYFLNTIEHSSILEAKHSLNTYYN